VVPSRDPLHVLVGMPFATRLGGAERLLETFLERADTIGVWPEVVLFEDGPWVRELAGLGVPVSVIRPGRFRHAHRNVAAALRLVAMLSRRRPDVVLGWISRAHVTLAPPAIAAGLGRHLAWYQWASPRNEAIERAATLLPARAVLACSYAGASAQRRMRPHRSVVVARPGIDVPARPTRAELDGLRTRLGIPGGRAIVGISARMVRWKGHDRVLRAVAELNGRGHDVHALVVGGTGHRLDEGLDGDLRVLAGELGLAGRATFTGHVPDALPYIALMDVAVNASEQEPFGIAVLEAMALERAVVAVDAGGPREIIEDGVTGMLVPSPSPADLADAIGPLLHDGRRRTALGRAARSQVLERFTVAGWLADVRTGLERAADGSG
jgi:glycosyltransferase involved in cell wall biosynthesis